MPLPFANIPVTNEDEKFMVEALREAMKAYKAGEVPVGAVLVHKGRVISRGHNQVEMLKDATAHAEMLCITAGEASLENWRLADTTLYCTIEPCAMCAGAMMLSRVPTLVWGAPDIRHGANGSWVDLFDKKHPTHSIEVRRGVLQEFSTAMMKDFFAKRRQENEGKRMASPCIEWTVLQKLLAEMVQQQHDKVYSSARRIVPNLTQEDLLQPNDFPQLENHPHFRYEEGVLEGLKSVQMALQAIAKK